MFEYPSHFNYPENERVWFKDHIDNWDKSLSFLFDKPNTCLEIGSYHGASSVYIRERLCSLEGSHLYLMDINQSEYLLSNIEPYENVTLFHGESRDAFKSFTHRGETKEFLDFVYIDGSHMSCHVLEDAVNAFYCLKDGGVMIFDDYLGGLEQEKHLQVKSGVDSFAFAFHKHLELFFNGYQLGLIKRWNFSEHDLKENYYPPVL
jgi:predicted O-methyltransferase YrrM